jgi:hypothetical protein
MHRQSATHGTPPTSGHYPVSWRIRYSEMSEQDKEATGTRLLDLFKLLSQVRLVTDAEEELR